MPVTTKYHGKKTVAIFDRTSPTATTIDLTATSRQITWNEQGDSIDATTRDDAIAGNRQFLDSGFTANTFNISGLDTTSGTSVVWNQVSQGDSGTVYIYPQGTAATGLPYKKTPMFVQTANYSSPYDNATTWELAFQANGTTAKGTTA